MGEVVCQRWLIAGRVQGVGYRAWMVDRATRLGLDGWVRNLPDGSVEAIVCGNDEALALMYQACLAGPWAARVDRIEDTGLAPDTAETRLAMAGPGFRQER